ncbi:MAG: hypothetical protein V1792_13485 [Pseudomonadota bacterium]
MPANRLATPASFNDEWFYGELSKFDREHHLDLKSWYKSNEGPRWRAMSHTVWSSSPERTEWKRLIERLPTYFGSEVVYLTDWTLESLRRIYPDFDTIFANHAYMEWLLYAEMDYGEYRDHIVHPVKVAMVAWWLLNELSDATERIRERLASTAHVQRLLGHIGLSKGIFGDGKIVNAAIWLAALFHDLGYGHNFLCGLETRLMGSFGFYAGDVVGGSIAGMHPDLIEKSLIKHHLDGGSTGKPINTLGRKKRSWPPAKEPWQTMLYDNLPRNHSIAGALNLLCINQEIVDHWPDVDPRLVLIFELAAEAVFLHDLTGEKSFSKIDFQISFDESPLGVLLILADEIQCWGRPVLKHRRGRGHQEIVIRFEPEREAVKYRLEHSVSRSKLHLESCVSKKLEKIRSNGGRVDWSGLLDIVELK